MRGARYARDWTKGSIFRNLLLLAWPMIILSGLYPMTYAIEMIWVGRLGAAAIAGVGIANIVEMPVMAVGTGINAGVKAMIARFVGAGDVEGANHVARQAFVLSATYGAVIAVIGVFFAEPILSLLGLKADVIAAGAAYLRIILTYWLPHSFWLTAFGIMPASGDPVTAMKVSIFIRFIHAVLAPFLIFGWWIFPRLGISGAALSVVIFYVLGMSITLWVLFSGRTRLRLTLRGFRLDPNIIWRILKIGIPASVTGMERSFANLFLVWFLVPFGTLAVAAHSLANRVDGLMQMPGTGLGSAAGVLVGQNLGAGQPERAGRSGWLAVGLAQVFMVACSVSILLWAEKMIGIFSTDPGLVELGSIFLRIASAGYLVMAFFSILQNCISGAGDTLPVMFISLAMVWLVQMPLAFFLSPGHWSRRLWSALGVSGWRGYGSDHIHDIFQTGAVEA